MNMNGVILYQGPSMLDGSPIIAIATGLKRGSSNTKTGGALIQTWIIRADMSPMEAINSGADAAICGDCPHRGVVVDGRQNKGRSCYVRVPMAPTNVYKGFTRGIYGSTWSSATFKGKRIRLGSYGDPAAVPFEVWQAVMSEADGGTGYTHQWRNHPELAQYVMASADSLADKIAANAMGFRTFRVKSQLEQIMPKEVVCPAAKEAGQRTTCSACMACGGLGAKARANIVINAHGGLAVMSNYARTFA